MAFHGPFAPSESPGPRMLPELLSLIYSIDVFLPFVDLHQEHYRWPDAMLTGECAVLGRDITLRGRVLR